MGDQDILRHAGTRPGDVSAPVKRGRNWIAAIGIDEYSAWPRLSNAASDAQGILALFTELDFEKAVDPLFNDQATFQAINALPDRLRKKLKPEDSVVLFFAGHGHTVVSRVGDTEVQTGYIIPADAAPPDDQDFSAYIHLEPFMQRLALLPARHILVILDACKSGIALGQAYVKLRDAPPPYTEDLDRRLSRHVITSALYNEDALDNGPVANHSVFTGVLIEALEKGKADAGFKGYVTGSQLATYVRQEVMQLAEQRSRTQTPDFGYFSEKIHSSEEMQTIERQAHYHLGRVLYEGELDFDRAVSELETTVRMDPDNVAALYYLGVAIRAQVERNTLKRAEQVFRQYLARGAPLGREDQVRELLGSRLTGGEI